MILSSYVFAASVKFHCKFLNMVLPRKSDKLQTWGGCERGKKFNDE